jgi:hypothetical protein
MIFFKKNLSVRKLHETLRARPKTAGPSSDNTGQPNSVSRSFSPPRLLLVLRWHAAHAMRPSARPRPTQLI